MTTAPSLQHPYDVILASDPAIAKPENGDEAGVAEFVRKLGIARDTGDYSALLIEGVTPVRYRIRHVAQKMLRRLHDRQNAVGDNFVGRQETAELCVQLGLVEVVGRDIKLEYDSSQVWGRKLRDSVTEQIGHDEVIELGTIIYVRSHADPKS